MLDQDLKNLWQNGSSMPPIEVNQDLLLQEVNRQTQDLNQKIRDRDRREIGVALLMIPLFAFVSWRFPFPLTKLGAGLAVPFCMFIIYQLRRNRSQQPQNIAVPVQEYLHQYREYLHRQMRLLQKAMYWYMMPLNICLLLYFLGFPSSKELLAFNLGIVAVINVLVYAANRHALKTELEPLLHKLDQAIALLENK
ncbi:hypothetical protein [Rufibacter immobilis]|uniref:hypothetical protein n=1 Tax=Rufibacter immobilis TaxID=1348778 RepID=UPI0035E7AA89